MTSPTTPVPATTITAAHRALLRRLPAASPAEPSTRPTEVAVVDVPDELSVDSRPSRVASGARGLRASVPVGPQPRAKAGLKQGDRPQVGPRGAIEDCGDRRRVDAAQASDGAGGTVAHLFAKPESEQSRGLGWHIVDRGDGPVVGESDRVRPGVARHDGIVGPTTAHEEDDRPSAPQVRLALLRGEASERVDISDIPLDAGSTHQRSEALVAQFIGAHGSVIPAAQWAAIESFVCAAITDMGFTRTHDAKNYFTAVTRLVHWAFFEAGLELDREVIFHPEVIATFISQGCDDLKASSRGTYRSRAFQVTDKFFPGLRGNVKNQALGDFDNAPEPYSAQDVIELRHWARNQGTQYRSANMTLMLALGLGAGLSNSEIAAVTAGDIAIDDGGVVVCVRGDRAREVTVLAEWEGEIAQLARAAMRPTLHLVCPRRRVLDNPSLIAALILDGSTPPVRVTVQRMRSTWIVGHLNARVPRDVIAQAAGIKDTEGLSRYDKFTTPTDQATARHLLRDGSEGTAA